MNRAYFLVTIQAVLVATSLWGQNGEANQKILVQEIRLTGELGLSLPELRDYTAYMVGRSTERETVLREAPNAIAMALRHQGYWKAVVTPEIRKLKDSKPLEDAKVVLKLVIKAGKQYRIKDITFVGLSTQVAQADLRHAFDIQTGDIADGNKITLGMHNLQILFQRKGEDVYVVPSLVFDDPASTISFRFDIRK